MKDQIICAFLYIITKHGYPPPASKSLHYLSEMKNLGFKCIELEGIREDHLMEVYRLRHEIREELLRLEMTMPVYCTVLPGLSSQDPGIRTKQLELFRYGCITAETLGATYVLDNCPIAPFIFPADIPVVRHYDDQVLADAVLPPSFDWISFEKSLIAQFQQVCDIAADHGLTYLLHPAVGTVSATPEAFLSFHQKVNRKNLGYNFDTANLIALRQNLSLAFQQLKAHIPYIHISDTKLNHHQHLALDHGEINWPLFFSELKAVHYQGYIGIDIGGGESKVSNLDQAYREAKTKVLRYLD